MYIIRLLKTAIRINFRGEKDMPKRIGLNLSVTCGSNVEEPVFRPIAIHEKTGKQASKIATNKRKLNCQVKIQVSDDARSSSRGSSCRSDYNSSRSSTALSIDPGENFRVVLLPGNNSAATKSCNKGALSLLFEEESPKNTKYGVDSEVTPSQREGADLVLLNHYNLEWSDLTEQQQKDLLTTGHLKVDLKVSYTKTGKDWVDSAQTACFASESRMCLNIDITPTPTELGASGSYFMKGDRAETVAIFKPADEEMGGKHGADLQIGYPKTHTVACAVDGVKSGHGSIFEVVAYKMTSFFEGLLVPETVRTSFASNAFNSKGCTEICTEEDLIKEGSLQKFVKGEVGTKIATKAIERSRVEIDRCNSEDQGAFIRKVSARAIEKRADPEQFAQMIAFDLALYGSDRNAGNILIDDDGNINLIDHSAILAQEFRSTMKCFWRHSDAASRQLPLKVINQIGELNPDSMIKEMKKEFALANEPFPEGHEKTLKHSVAMLQEGVKLGLTPCQMISLYDVQSSGGFGGESKMSNASYSYHGADEGLAAYYNDLLSTSFHSS